MGITSMFCPRCNTQNLSSEKKCTRCNEWINLKLEFTPTESKPRTYFLPPYSDKLMDQLPIVVPRSVMKSKPLFGPDRRFNGKILIYKEGGTIDRLLSVINKL